MKYSKVPAITFKAKLEYNLLSKSFIKPSPVFLQHYLESPKETSEFLLLESEIASTDSSKVATPISYAIVGLMLNFNYEVSQTPSSLHVFQIKKLALWYNTQAYKVWLQ